MLKKLWILQSSLWITLCFLASPLWAESTNRFFYSGDGSLTINQVKITFRKPDGTYDEAGLKRFTQIMNGSWEPVEERLSLRFIEILDYVQDQLNGQSYLLKSGYRSPTLNQSLRNKGKLAAQSSMHIEGAAADLILSGVPPSTVFDFVKSLNCCGIGWYHSAHFHLDAGPARYWDETSSKTEDKTPQENEKIILVSDQDRYYPGEDLTLKFMRVSEYPIGIPGRFDLTAEGSDQSIASLAVREKGTALPEKECSVLDNRSQARSLAVKLPEKGLKPGKYALKIRFCNRFAAEKMPESIATNTFEIMEKK